MPLTTYEPIHKSKIEYQIHERYQREIRDLEALGFRELCYTREVVFPFSVLLFFWVYPLMAFKHEVFRIEWPLRYVIMNPLYVSDEAGTYAHIFGMGVKFYTDFLDGTELISCTFTGTNVIRKDCQFYKYYALPHTGTAIHLVWKQHQQRIAQMEERSSQRGTAVSLEHFEALSQRDDQISMFGFASKPKQKRVSKIGF